jgi:hypothetical protein
VVVEELVVCLWLLMLAVAACCKLLRSNFGHDRNKFYSQLRLEVEVFLSFSQSSFFFKQDSSKEAKLRNGRVAKDL